MNPDRPSLPKRFTRSKEIVVAKVIEFYLPRSFRRAFVRAAETQTGKHIEFCSRENMSVSMRPVGEALERLLAATESNHAVGIE
jgi:hypothetical protein